MSSTIRVRFYNPEDKGSLTLELPRHPRFPALTPLLR